MRPAFPRKIRGDALTTRTSCICEFALEIFFFDDEDADPPPCQLGQKLGAAHLGELRKAPHEVSREIHVAASQRREKALGNTDLQIRHWRPALASLHLRVLGRI